MPNFYVVSVAPDMVNDTDRSTTCWSKFKAPHYKEKYNKWRSFLKTWVSPNNRLNNSDQKLKTCTFDIRE